jgi:hypothetical protein
MIKSIFIAVAFLISPLAMAYECNNLDSNKNPRAYEAYSYSKDGQEMVDLLGAKGSKLETVSSFVCTPKSERDGSGWLIIQECHEKPEFKANLLLWVLTGGVAGEIQMWVEL